MVSNKTIYVFKFFFNIQNRDFLRFLSCYTRFLEHCTQRRFTYRLQKETLDSIDSLAYSIIADCVTPTNRSAVLRLITASPSDSQFPNFDENLCATSYSEIGL